MSVCKLEDSSPVLDTYFEFGNPGKVPFVLLDMSILCVPVVDGFGECLMCIMFRKKRMQLFGIEGAVGVKPLLDDLQLGSAGVEVGHSEREGLYSWMVVSVAGGEWGFLSGSFLYCHPD
jgi:hypothetical protein